MEALVNIAYDRISEDIILLYDAMRAYNEVRRAAGASVSWSIINHPDTERGEKVASAALYPSHVCFDYPLHRSPFSFFWLAAVKFVMLRLTYVPQVAVLSPFSLIFISFVDPQQYEVCLNERAPA